MGARSRSVAGYPIVVEDRTTAFGRALISVLTYLAGVPFRFITSNKTTLLVRCDICIM